VGASSGVRAVDPASEQLHRHFGVSPQLTESGTVVLWVALLELMATFGFTTVRLALAAIPGRPCPPAAPTSPPHDVATSAVQPVALPVGEVAIADVAISGSARAVADVATSATTPMPRPSRPALTLVPSGRPAPVSVGNLALDLGDLPDIATSAPVSVVEAVVVPLIATSADVDPVAVFASTCIERRDGAQVQASVLFEAYAAWRQRHGQEPGTINAFGAAMSSMGYRKAKSSRVHYLGIALTEAAA
jgi:hypothetical protein